MSTPTPPQGRPLRTSVVPRPGTTDDAGRAGAGDAKDGPMSQTSTGPRTASSGSSAVPPAEVPVGGSPTAGATPAAGRPAASSAPRQAVPGPRRVRLAISRVDPWSVMKLSFLLSFAVGIIIVVATAVLWLTLDGLGVFAQVDELITTVVGDATTINVLDYLRFPRVVSAAMLVAVIDVVLLTAIATIGAFLYNLVAALVGGLHVTMTDD
ncbi:DUF3566 domain-containing protein [Cellulomonas marina]|uniref:DUF3566 domain-containing protein n=1 Tax=Cellulomonas marina TaxID=988821 RepID=A0A1I1AAF3_9CELL|nr:DUF3566 domain-containing protein [Cellulomonas marina]GIG30582.1 membrane protein [Cellulomonas marina]SFB34346.1 Transmembrane protein of unknown function [Cellulomonas marina]